MSLVHVRIRKTHEDDSKVTYVAETADISAGERWDELGTLTILKKERRYGFQLSSLAIEKKFLPPEVYGLSDSERAFALSGKYSDLAWGAWSMQIHAWATQFAEQGSYPDNFPPGMPQSR